MAGADVGLIVEGIGGPVMGWVLSTVQRTFHDRRAAERAHESAERAREAQAQQSRWDQIQGTLARLAEQNEKLQLRLVRVETRVETAVELRPGDTISRGTTGPAPA